MGPAPSLGFRGWHVSQLDAEMPPLRISAAAMGKEAFTFHGNCRVDGTSGDHSCSPLEDEANKKERARRWKKYAVQISLSPRTQPCLKLTTSLD